MADEEKATDSDGSDSTATVEVPETPADEVPPVPPKEDWAEESSWSGPIHPEQGPPHPAADIICPTCGAWHNKKGEPFTQGGLNFHRISAHGYRSPKAKKKETAKPGGKGTDPISDIMALEDPPPERSQTGDVADDDGILDFDEYEFREKTRNLTSALRANTLLAKNEVGYIINHWKINSGLRDDPRTLYDFLMRLPKLNKHPEWANDIVDITFAEDEYDSRPSSYRGRSGYRPRRGRHEPPRYHGRGHRDDRYEDDHYDDDYDDRRRGYQGRDDRGPPERGYMSPREFKAEMRRARMDWNRDQDLGKYKAEIEELKQMLRNPPKDEMTPQDIIAATVKALEEKKGSTGPSQSELRMMDEMKEVRKEMEKTREEARIAKTEAAVRGATEPLQREFATLKSSLDSRTAATQARDSYHNELEQKGAFDKGMNDQATVAVEEIKSQTKQFTTVAENLNNTVTKGLDAIVKMAAPGGPQNVQTQGMSDKEKAELDRIAKGG